MKAEPSITPAPKAAHVVREVPPADIRIDAAAYAGIDLESAFAGTEAPFEAPRPIIIARGLDDGGWEACSGAQWLTAWAAPVVDVMPAGFGPATARLLARISTASAKDGWRDCALVAEAWDAVESDGGQLGAPGCIPTAFTLGCAIGMSGVSAIRLAHAGKVLSPKLRELFDESRLGLLSLDAIERLHPGQRWALFQDAERADMSRWTPRKVARWISEFSASPWSEADECASLACEALERLGGLGEPPSAAVSQQLAALAAPYARKTRRK